MADNLAFLNNKINAYKVDIEHIKHRMEKCLDSAEEQVLRSQRIKCTNEMMNYIELRDQYTAA